MEYAYDFIYPLFSTTEILVLQFANLQFILMFLGCNEYDINSLNRVL